MKQEKRIFLKPGKTNKEERKNFIKYWVAYMKSHTDEEWGEEQNNFINSQLSQEK